MKTGELIPFNRPMHLLKKAKALFEDMDLFFSDTYNGVTCLLDALPYCQPLLTLKIIPLLGYAGKDRVLWPLYNLIFKPNQDEQIRISAAIQLGTAASLSRDPSSIIILLIDNLDYPEPSVRSSCALALGWEGNNVAVNSLLLRLVDSDRDVQASVVTALSAIGGKHVFDQLTKRLQFGSVEEKRSVLLNLWRFVKQAQQVEHLYVDAMDCVEPELRVDLISGLGMIPLSDKVIEFYRCFLREEDFQIIIQILKNLSAFDPAQYRKLKETLVELAENGEDLIRQLSIRLLSRG